MGGEGAAALCRALSCKPAKLLGCQTERKRLRRLGGRRGREIKWRKCGSERKLSTLSYTKFKKSFRGKVANFKPETTAKTWGKWVHQANFYTSRNRKKGLKRDTGRLALMQKYAVNCTDGWVHRLPNFPAFSHVIWSWDGSRQKGGWPSVCWKCCSQTTLLYQEDAEALPTPSLLRMHVYTCTNTMRKHSAHKKDQGSAFSVLVEFLLQ